MRRKIELVLVLALLATTVWLTVPHRAVDVALHSAWLRVERVAGDTPVVKAIGNPSVRTVLRWAPVGLLAAFFGWVALGVCLLYLSVRVWHRQTEMEEGFALEVVVPKGADASAKRMAAMLRQVRFALPSAGLRGGTHFSLELVYRDGAVHFGIWGPRKYEGLFTSALRGAFPRARVIARDNLVEGLGTLHKGDAVVWQNLELVHSFLPLRRNFELEEPLDVLIEALECRGGVSLTALAVICRPAPGTWRRELRGMLAGMQSGTSSGRSLPGWQRAQLAALEEKVSTDAFDVIIRVAAAGPDRVACGQAVWNISRALAQYRSDAGGAPQHFIVKRSGVLRVHENPFLRGPEALPGRSRTGREMLRLFAFRSMPAYFGEILPFGIGRRRMSVLTPEEVAWLWYPPGPGVASGLVNRSGATFLRPPAQAFLKEGEMAFQDGRAQPHASRIALGKEEDGPRYLGPTSLQDWTKHVYILGPTGSGKTELQRFIVQQWLRLGQTAGGPFGLAYIDAKGPGITAMVAMVPTDRERDVLLFDPTADWVIPFNPLDHRLIGVLGPQKVALGALGILERAVGGWSQTAVGMEEVLRMAFLAVAYGEPRPTMQKVLDLLDDETYRQEVLQCVRDRNPAVCDYFEQEYPTRTVQQSATAARRRLRRLLTSDVIRHIVAVEDSVLDFLEVIDGRKILLARIGTDLGEDQSPIGALIFNGFVAAGRTRYLRLQKEIGQPMPLFLLIVDEFQNFANLSGLDEMVSMMRGANLCAVFAHQYVRQLDDRVLAAIFGNVGTKVVFPLEDDQDARRIAAQSGGVLDKDDLLSARPYHPYVCVPGQGWYGIAAQMPIPLEETPTEPPRPLRITRPLDELDRDAERLLQMGWAEAAALLVGMDIERCDAVLTRIRQRRRAEAEALLSNPGAIPDKFRRVTEISNRLYGVWKAEIEARLVRKRSAVVKAAELVTAWWQ